MSQIIVLCKEKVFLKKMNRYYHVPGFLGRSGPIGRAQLQTEGPGLEPHLAKHRHVREWHLVHIKSIMGAISVMFSFKFIPLSVLKWGKLSPPC